MREKLFWALVAISSVAAAAFGYHRFKQIRPDLYGQGSSSVPETERAARISEYQEKGDGIPRRVAREPHSGETCIDGYVVDATQGGDLESRRIVENGQPVRCGDGAR